MIDTRVSQPLSDDEFDRLGGFLAQAGPTAMNLETLDGFFVALICGPEPVPPSEYLPHVWGDDHVFESDEEAVEILGLVMRHWNTIATTLEGTLRKDDVYLPVLLEDEQSVAHGNDWARGFMRGVQMRPASWQDLLTRDDLAGMMLPILILIHEHDADPTMRSPPISPEKRLELLQLLAASLTHIYRHFESARRSPAMSPAHRATRKIGRNEPCPCGSGRKFKHCCAGEPKLQ